MSAYIHKSHNVSVLLYHFVCPAKYRKVVFDPEVDIILKDVCLEISKRFQTHIVRIIKSITAREIFKQLPKGKSVLWGGEF